MEMLDIDPYPLTRIPDTPFVHHLFTDAFKELDDIFTSFSIRKDREHELVNFLSGVFVFKHLPVVEIVSY